MSDQHELQLSDHGHLMVPHTGEVLDTSDLQRVAQALKDAREFKAYGGKLDRFIRACEATLIEYLDREGKRSEKWGTVEVKTGPGEEVDYDVTVLIDLLDAGLPQHRYDDLVKTRTEYRVDKREVARIRAAKPEYAEIIDKARVVKTKERHVY